MKLLRLLCFVSVLFVGCVKQPPDEGEPCSNVVDRHYEEDVPYQDGALLKFAVGESETIEQVVTRSATIVNECYRRETVKLSNSAGGFTASIEYSSSRPGRIVSGSFSYEDVAEASGLSWYLNEYGSVGPNSPYTGRIIADTTISGINYQLLGVIPYMNAAVPTDLKNLYFHPDHGIVALEWVDRPTISLLE